MNEEYSPETEVAPDDKDTRTWAMILHLSMLSGLVVPLAGLIVPIVIYLLKKDELPGLVPHGHVVFNWMISAVIYAIISMILMIIVIGGFLLMALALVSLIFPIIGGVKASEGEVWPYPLSIKFFK
ncbi:MULTISPECIES: DUF4870 domain-containing protein [unclassified Wenzhouxiangella]|uniref:DUF4870 domain-containing protein n=1 Tax=unclassified Wenzhouxiangella TaxID=2613841 RepID=UPI000E32B9F0|nr:MULTISPECIES: DUF4870 domain-containing protein [unclassified Wenzhouxiangella]RFF27222.1 DUF4870 domain-containing protein [Wenzhouxiangella sp. 15181]RFP69092.1 DUF4870 domain-containing protein [Wenzhouxiangella sp. 15190]